ncbi:unnamed protein product [Adineta ricciae]|uniref:Uncharacterized protein n=1 Tax=Adineta ricciae TaxID=249248 RepID=A0A815F9R5_ADIRI|nr:unnamed protein product [Adineta ricciae]
MHQRTDDFHQWIGRLELKSKRTIRTDCSQTRILIITTDKNILDQLEQVQYNEKSDRQNSTQKKSKPKVNDLICVVCGSPANGYNFGAIACESCKAFFRRNARKDPKSLHCVEKGDCKITPFTRRFCSSCRLTKCLNNGMQCDRIWTIEQKAEKRRQIEENKKLAMNSNVQSNEEKLPSTSCLDDLSMDTNILFTDFTEFLLPQAQLNANDLQRIETISDSYQRRIEFAAREGLPWDPSIPTKTFIQVLNSHSVHVMRLLSFFKQIPEFNQLDVNDRVTLIKYNLNTLLGINCALWYKKETHELIEDDADVPSNMQFYQILHGYKTCLESRKIFLSLLHLASYDRKIIQLILIILLLTKGFSITNPSDEQIFNDGTSVDQLHNYYTELLWKYMETMHGYAKAVNLFSELLAHITSWQIIHEEMRNNILRTLSPDDTNELLPIMKSILRVS